MNTIESIDFVPFHSAVQPPSLFKRLRSWWNKKADQTRPVPSSDPATYSPCQPEEQLGTYRKLLEEASAIYVFRNGTAVWSASQMSESEAIILMREHGPVRVGTPSADFHVAEIESPVSGFAVKYAHPQIVSFAGHFPPGFNAAAIGSMIRLGRDMDSYDLTIVARYTQEK